MSKKQLFTLEFPVRCSPSILFDFLATPAGLQEWFADKVRIDEDKNYIFNFDQEDHYAKQNIIKANLHVRWDFFDPKSSASQKESYIEFKLDEAELTQSLFLKVVDQSNFYSLDELEGIWDGLIAKLKGTIGG